MTELFNLVYDAETGEIEQVPLTPEEIADFNARLAAHEAAQLEQQPTE